MPPTPLCCWKQSGVVERLVPLERAKQVGDAPLVAAGNELLHGLGYGSLLRAFTADLLCPIEQVWIDCEIRGQV